MKKQASAKIPLLWAAIPRFARKTYCGLAQRQSEHGVVARARAIAVDDHVFPVGPGTVIDFGQITEPAQGTRTVGERGKGLPAQCGPGYRAARAEMSRCPLLRH